MTRDADEVVRLRERLAAVEVERGELRDRSMRLAQQIAAIRAMRLHPLCCDGENGAEVDAYHDGYKDALQDMRDILHTMPTAVAAAEKETYEKTD